jgi:dipeptidyl aminopeptidase/acylaminoacyl peptidase
VTAASPKTAPYGAWTSPITAELITGATVGLAAVAVGDDAVWWLESRAGEGGRSVLVAAAGGLPRDVTPQGFNLRSRVHEYGGGAALVADGIVYFVNFEDQRVYVQRPGAAPRAITGDGPWRYADFRLDATRDRLICVRETARSGDEPANELVAIGLADGDVTVIDGGHDFVASPVLDSAGSRLAWLAWDHPNMPWDGTILRVAELEPDGTVRHVSDVAGGAIESIFQPAFGPDGSLFFVSDRSGWWNLYRAAPGGAVALCPAEAEFGLPQWVFGMSTWGIAADGRIVAACVADGRWRLGTVEAERFAPFDLPYDDVHDVRVCGDAVLFVGASPAIPPTLARLDLADGTLREIKSSNLVPVDPAYLSTPEPLSYPTSGGAVAHALYYPPKNAEFAAPADEKPPLIVRGHGGPTAASGSALNLGIQFWTSRGFAVLDVNYRGSTGFGRRYREALYGQWGVVDVDDVVAGADALVARGLADPARLAIRGGSAGGYTTLAALAFRDRFSAGASQYGIGDLMALARDTHKFESRYLDRLIGPLPESEAIYRARSPINFTERLSCPVIFLQGLDDKVVPPNQAEAMVAALDAKGLPVAYVAFEGEGHGFRKAANVRRALEAELAFYGRIFGFAPAGDLPPLEIRNLPPHRE